MVGTKKGIYGLFDDVVQSFIQGGDRVREEVLTVRLEGLQTRPPFRNIFFGGRRGDLGVEIIFHKGNLMWRGLLERFTRKAEPLRGFIKPKVFPGEDDSRKEGKGREEVF